ncbi:putative phage abortive infection protein [Aeromonas media]|uniref:putative phage abortive infection protein n=1 Tax=Aeromonas media TaxID=651 RepID=UPI0015FCD56C|nr:putative phage abortive infection protein [Aeromonas media]
MSKNDNKNGWYFIVFILVLVLGMWFSYPFWSYIYKDFFYNTEFSEMGVFGDSYGALNTLFSAFAFTGIIASIYFQREELKATREELEATRNEMKNQGEQFEAQTNAINLQVFENTFFNMLKLHGDIVETITKTGLGGVENKGRQVFSDLYSSYASTQQSVGGVPENDVSEGVSRYDSWYVRNEFMIGHYFRVFMNILTVVDRSTLSDEKKKNYAHILRAQISTFELVLICLHFVSRYEEGECKKLIERYNMLEHISAVLLIRGVGKTALAKYIIDRYDETAFGNKYSDISTLFCADGL